MTLTRNKRFSHIYVETEVMDHPHTRRILSQFPEARVIEIDRYESIFNRSGQSYQEQFPSQSLILAAKHGTKLYQGAPVCQDFDNRWFYYTVPAMNCLYNCAYCWLKGMYSGADMVVFVNTEDFLAETEELLRQHPVYLCLAYETDLVPIENMTSLLADWSAFTAAHAGLSVEIRTKCAARDVWRELPVCDRIIPAFTLSPDEVVSSMERGTPSLEERLQAVRTAVECGFPVRICYDPVFRIPGWKEAYARLVQATAEAVPMERLRDISVGTFRLSAEYMRNMRKRFPDEPVIQYPYVCEHGYYHNREADIRGMEDFMVNLLTEYVPRERIFLESRESRSICSERTFPAGRVASQQDAERGRILRGRQ